MARDLQPRVTSGPAATIGEAAAGCDAPGRLLLVYQMGKVASMSWMLLGRQHFGIAEHAHVHYMAPQNLAFLRRQYEAIGPSQTLLRTMPLRNMLHSGERARALLAHAATAGRPVLLVTGMRDPIARSASLFSFIADFAGHSHGGLFWRDGATLEEVERAFIAIWEQILGGDAPDDTFGRLVHFVIGVYRSWFDSEISAVLGIDIARPPLPPGLARRLFAHGRTQVLIYRVEDMAEHSAGYAVLRADVEAVCGRAFPGFPLQNVTGSRRSGEFYRSFLSRLRMPGRLIDQIYAEPVVRHFYTAEEIAGFRRRWSTGAAN